MIRTLKALSALLTYPDAELQAAAPDVADALRAEGLLDAAQIAALEPLLGELAQNDLFDLQERFVLLFDRSRTLSLNLFEHVHGESRERGGAMVDLLETYRAGGFEPIGAGAARPSADAARIPRHPSAAEARDMLADAVHIFVALAERLERRGGSPYAPVFRALEALAASPAVAELLAEITARAGRRPRGSRRPRRGLGGGRRHLRPRSQRRLSHRPRPSRPHGTRTRRRPGPTPNAAHGGRT